MMLQPGEKIITTDILPNISNNKDNQKMKFSQLIEYNMRNLKKPYTKCGGERDPFLKNHN